MIPTPDTYHAPESNRAFMSVSQFKAFASCQAKALAELRGEVERVEIPAFAFGHYVDAALLTPDRLTSDMDANPDAYTYRGKLRAWVEDAQSVVERCKRDAYFMEQLKGNAQEIITFDMFGASWKAMIDVYNPDTRMLVDLKTTANIDEEKWSELHEQRVPFYEQFGYWLQLAVYREAVKVKYGEYPLSCKIAVVSKQTPPDIRVITFDNPLRFKRELAKVEAMLPTFMAVKSGHAQPTRCERCEYCRSTRVLTCDELAASIETQTITFSEFIEA